MDSILYAEFFGIPMAIDAPGLNPLLRFYLGPHTITPPEAEPRLHLTVTPTTGHDTLPVEIEARDTSGAPLLRRTWRGWGNLPPALPPFALWRDRYAIAPAVVVATDDVTVALLASADTRHTLPAAALARHGWRFIAGSLLVLDRHTGEALPCHLPLQAAASVSAALGGPQASLTINWHEPATDLDADHPDACLASSASSTTHSAWRRCPSELGSETLLARPEAFGTLAPIRSRWAAPTLIRVCPDSGEGVRLENERFAPPAWPSEAHTALSNLPLLRLTLPEGGAQEAARLIQTRLTQPTPTPAPDRSGGPAPPRRHHPADRNTERIADRIADRTADRNQEEPCPSASTTRREHRAGSTASLRA